MTITIDRQLMDAMYGPRLKLFIASVDTGHFSGELNDDALDAAGVELIRYDPNVDANSEARLQSFRANGGDFVKLATPPTGPCLLAAATPHGRDRLASLLGWWRENGPSGPPDMVEPDESSPSDHAAWQMRLMRRLLEMAQSDARRSAEREVMLCSQLSELRNEYEQARASIQSMQDSLARMSAAACSLSYAYAPSSEEYHPKRDDEVIRQSLPIQALGLAGIDLFIPPSNGSTSDTGHFLVTLIARESPEPMGTWMVAGNYLSGGWARCAFPIALTSPFHQLELTVQWCGPLKNCPGLALSPIQPWKELCAFVNGERQTGALAHAVWSALPGARTGLGSSPIRNADDAKATFTHLVSRDAIARAVPTTSTTAHYLDPLSNPGGFRLHPLDGVIASAVVPDACLPGTQSIAAVAQISHPAARHPVEYAMALTRASAKHRTFPQDSRTADVVAISEWQSVPADGSPHVVGLTLPNPGTYPLDLHVATRMPNDLPTAHQWADWLEVRVTLCGLAPIMPVGL